MNDLISRQAAIEAVWLGSYSKEQGDVLKILIQNIPSAQQWIPCSERLPEEYREYLVCYTNDDAVGLLWLDDTRESKAIVKRYYVLAWMPLPQPYKGEEE